ncbi:MAG: hypothetical protein QXU47_07585 [Candidatus Bathyarchaeia archaeon]
MDVDRVLGYCLISIGLGMILSSICLMYAVFTNHFEPPHILSFKDVKFLISPPTGGAPIETTVIQGSQLSKFANMLLWTIFMFFIVSAGGKLCDVGVKLVRGVKK